VPEGTLAKSSPKVLIGESQGGVNDGHTLGHLLLASDPFRPAAILPLERRRGPPTMGSDINLTYHARRPGWAVISVDGRSLTTSCSGRTVRASSDKKAVSGYSCAASVRAVRGPHLSIWQTPWQTPGKVRANHGRQQHFEGAADSQDCLPASIGCPA